MHVHVCLAFMHRHVVACMDFLMMEFIHGMRYCSCNGTVTLTSLLSPTTLLSSLQGRVTALKLGQSLKVFMRYCYMIEEKNVYSMACNAIQGKKKVSMWPAMILILVAQKEWIEAMTF